jgi:hypothetical protein
MASSGGSRNTMAGDTAEGLTNPFEVTKATDFDDSQIAATWVDFPGVGGFRSLIDPRSPVAQFVLGGKGSGRTHLLRWYSSGLQGLRLRETQLNSLSAEGYVGVYVSSSTLNAGRFSGKGQTQDTWNAYFSYYFDLWLAARTLMAADEVWTAVGREGLASELAGPGILKLFDVAPKPTQSALPYLRNALKEVDFAVNEAAATRVLRASILASPGRLLFGTVAALQQLGEFTGIQVAMLLDEFENFSEAQQRYVNTLIREKNPSVGFLVGARTLGIKSFSTLADEVNREGSEFATIVLDSLHLQKSREYRQFCRELVARRLIQAGVFARGNEKSVASPVESHFVEYLRTRLGQPETVFVSESGLDQRRSVARLRNQLREYRPASLNGDDIDMILSMLHWPQSPLVEKLSIYLFYRAWNQQENLCEAAARIRAEAESYAQGHRAPLFALAMGHFREDMLAQLLKDYRQKQRYLGFKEFVELSAGLPRALVVVLKHIFRWAVFNGESPFMSGDPISEEAQRAGVVEAADWFFQDLAGIGTAGAQTQRAIERLGNFLKALRFSDKPSESSLCTVSLNLDGLSAEARALINHCIGFSFLVRIKGGHKDRNIQMRREKLQLHPMLCPLWDLPTGRRGVIQLSTEEAGAIFDESKAYRLETLVRTRLRRMNAPFRSTAEPSNTARNLYD